MTNVKSSHLGITTTSEQREYLAAVQKLPNVREVYLFLPHPDDRTPATAPPLRVLVREVSGLLLPREVSADGVASHDDGGVAVDLDDHALRDSANENIYGSDPWKRAAAAADAMPDREQLLAMATQVGTQLAQTVEALLAEQTQDQEVGMAEPSPGSLDWALAALHRDQDLEDRTGLVQVGTMGTHLHAALLGLNAVQLQQLRQHLSEDQARVRENYEYARQDHSKIDWALNHLADMFRTS